MGARLRRAAPPQLSLLTLLDAWGAAGLAAHLRAVQVAYATRRDVLLGALDEHLGSGGDAAGGGDAAAPLATWEPPAAGMFVWVRQHIVADRDIYARIIGWLDHRAWW